MRYSPTPSRRLCSACGHNYSVQSPPKHNWSCDHCGGEVVQRDDDKPDAIRRRLDLYEEQTRPLIDFYKDRSLLGVIDGTQTQDDVFDACVVFIDGLIA